MRIKEYVEIFRQFLLYVLFFNQSKHWSQISILLSTCEFESFGKYCSNLSFMQSKSDLNKHILNFVNSVGQNYLLRLIASLRYRKCILESMIIYSKTYSFIKLITHFKQNRSHRRVLLKNFDKITHWIDNGTRGKFKLKGIM